MSSALDMSLDDIIKNNKKPAGENPRRRAGGSGGTGPARRTVNRSGGRAAPYSTGKAPESAWQHNGSAFQNPVARVSSIETGTKLYISNLDYGVSTDDIKELFTEVGDLKRSSVHYDRSGRSKGTAEVVFSRRVDASAAVRRYNNVQLDGKPMKIEIVGANIPTPAAMPLLSNGGFGNPNEYPKSGLATGGGSTTGGRRRRGGRGRGRGRGTGGAAAGPVSAADLDADLDKYHSETMEIN